MCPYTVFANFKIYNTYHQSSNTASLYTSSKQLYFDLNTGETYDGEGNYYNVTPISRGGVVYVPVDFICQQYGLSWSYIEGSEYGDVCRITDSGAHLTDAQFLTAAKQLMSSRYNAYTGNSSGTEDPITGIDITSDCVIYLSFVGLPSQKLLDTLSEYGVSAGFFLTADELRQEPETVRRIVGEGHSIGALCYSDPLGEYIEFRSLLLDAAHATTVLIASGDRLLRRRLRKGGRRKRPRLLGLRQRLHSVRQRAGVHFPHHRIPRIPTEQARFEDTLHRHDRCQPPVRSELSEGQQHNRKGTE